MATLYTIRLKRLSLPSTVYKIKMIHAFYNLWVTNILMLSNENYNQCYRKNNRFKGFGSRLVPFSALKSAESCLYTTTIYISVSQKGKWCTPWCMKILHGWANEEEWISTDRLCLEATTCQKDFHFPVTQQRSACLLSATSHLSNFTFFFKVAVS